MNEPTPPVPNAALILDRTAIDRCLKRLAHEIIERNPDLARVALAGIPSRGVHLPQRLPPRAARAPPPPGRSAVQGVGLVCGVPSPRPRLPVLGGGGGGGGGAA